MEFLYCNVIMWGEFSVFVDDVGGSVGNERLALDSRVRRRGQPGQPPQTEGAQTEGGGAPQGAALDRNQTGNTHLKQTANIHFN